MEPLHIAFWEPDDPFHQLFIPGKCVDIQSGLLTDSDRISTFFEPVRVEKGAVVRSCSGDAFRIRYYTPEIRAELIHTYTYDPEANYTSFIPGAYPDSFSSEPAVIAEEGYIRIELECLTDDPLTKRIEISDNNPRGYVHDDGSRRSEQKITEKLEEHRGPQDSLFLLLSDTHYGCGSIFEETAFRIASLTEKVNPDALIHLGDLTDGSLTKEWTEKYSRRVISTLKKACARCVFLIGNHDYNYFRGNPDLFTRKQCEDLYLDGQQENRIMDMDEKNLRLIFLSSFDPDNKHRYGFRAETVLFLIKALLTVPRSYRVLVFSHVPPLGVIHYWDKNIRNSGAVIRILEYAQKKRKNILAYIHGHNHCDQVYRKRSFPIIGIGPSKLEDFQDKKPKGSVTYSRNMHDESAVLFDLLLVKEKDLVFLRCGAGEDRIVHADL